MVFIKISICWDNRKGVPFVKDGVPVMDPDKKIVSDLIREEVSRKAPLAKYTDSDVKIAISKDGFNLVRMLAATVSALMELISDEKPKELHVVINHNNTAEPEVVDLTAKLMESLRPKNVVVNSKITEVMAFHAGLESASNEEVYLQDYGRNDIKGKPIIDAQIETLVVGFLNDNNLSYHGPRDGKKGAKCNNQNN